MKLLRSLLLGTLLLALMGGCALLPAEEQPAVLTVVDDANKEDYDFSYVTRGDLEQWVSIDCKYQSLQQEQLAFQYEGRVVGDVYVDIGDIVKPGQLVAELKNEELDKALENAQEEASRAARALKYAKIGLEIVSNSYDMYSLTEDYEENVAKLEEDSRLAQKRLEELTEEKKSECLYAGIEGMVTFVRDYSNYNLSNPKNYTVIISGMGDNCFYADTEYFGSMAPGMEVDLTTDEGDLPAVVTDPETLGLKKPEVKSNGKSRVYFVLKNESTMLNEKSSAKLELLLDSRRDVLIVQSKAVFKAGDQNYVFYENSSGVREAKPVKLGLHVSGRYEVLSGLEEGEALIVS